MAYLYIITHKETQRMYVGITSKTCQERWDGHIRGCKTKKQHFPNALRKYGKDAFDWEECIWFDTFEEAEQAEIFWIAELKKYNQILFNSSEGGHCTSKGFKHTEEYKNNLSKRMKGNKYALGSRGRLGLKSSQESVRKMVLSKTQFSSEEEKNIFNEYQKNYNFSEVGRKFQCSSWTVARIVNSFNPNNSIEIKTRPPPTKLFSSPEKEIEIFNEYKKGKSCNFLAKQYGCGADIISRIVKKIGNFSSLDKKVCAETRLRISISKKGKISPFKGKKTGRAAPNRLFTSPDEEIKIFEEYKINPNYNAIARKYDCDDRVIKRIVEKLLATEPQEIIEKILEDKNKLPHKSKLFSSEQEKEIFNKYKNGQSCNKISKEYGCSMMAIGRVVKMLGNFKELDSGIGRRKFSADKEREIFEEYKITPSIRGLARKYNCDRDVIKRIVKSLINKGEK